jgi:PncC family amidohydrolase
MQRIEERVGDLLRDRGATIAVAESCTGGLIAHWVTNASGSSDYFDCGVVSYSNRAKADLLGVPLALIDTEGPVSESVAREMAEGIRKKGKTTLGLATTGVAGPQGGSPDTPIGTVFIALADPVGTRVRKYQFAGTREEIKRLAAEKALEMVLEYVGQRGKQR